MVCGEGCIKKLLDLYKPEPEIYTSYTRIGRGPVTHNPERRPVNREERPPPRKVLTNHL